jgi:hypothetical protein
LKKKDVFENGYKGERQGVINERICLGKMAMGVRNEGERVEVGVGGGKPKDTH